MDMLKKNEIYSCEITGWSSDGAGVTHIKGLTVFVPGAIPGEAWDVRIVKVLTASAFGKGERCLRAVPERIAPDCPAYPRCGGCALRHMTYEKELEFKRSRVDEAYRRIGGLDLRVTEILGAEKTEGYRNKAIYAVDGLWRPGFFRQRSHDVIPIHRCRLQAESADRAAWAVCDFCREHGVPVYDETTGKGVLRHVFTRTARDGLRQLGGERLTLPLEVHEKDLPDGKDEDLELVVYGRAPLMISAQCVAKTRGACLKEAGRPALREAAFTALTDRTGAEFPCESRCRFCLSVLWNSVPTYIGDLPHPAAALRIQLTNESLEETRRLLAALAPDLKEGGTPVLPSEVAFTRGNYRRGVQ